MNHSKIYGLLLLFLSIIFIIVTSSMKTTTNFKEDPSLNYTGEEHRPLIAGLKIEIFNGTSIRVCTIGYLAFRPADLTSRTGLVTAASCAGFRTGDNVYQPMFNERAWIGNVTWINQSIGVAYVSVNETIVRSVTGRMDPVIPHDGIGEVLPLLHVENNTKYVLRIIDKVEFGHLSYYQGRKVCKTGATSATTCGIILGYNKTCYVNMSGKVVEASYCIYHNATILPGDEGAPLYYLYSNHVMNGSYVALIGIVVGRDVSNNLTVAIGIDSALENDIVPFTYTCARERTRPLIGGVILNWGVHCLILQ